ncbi:hypothetical protein, partial [Nocardia cyriacigeorgica]|uniref:hypothetical protein n=1 Tax=Nocardia cyriacigeorgica TaxID=135487 RepID=UPI00245564D3
MSRYELLIKNGIWFDGTGAAPRTAPLGVRDGEVVEITSAPLDAAEAAEVIRLDGAVEISIQL